MASVIEFRKLEPKEEEQETGVWECGDCGSSAFCLFEDGDVVCAECGTRSSTLICGERY